MLFDSITLSDEVTNLTVDSGSSFPTEATAGELFFYTSDSQLYIYSGTEWSQVSGVTAAEVPKITSIVVADSAFNSLDDLAAPLSAAYLKVVGSGFADGATVKIGASDFTPTFSSSSELRVTVPSFTAGTYTVYVSNPDGSVAIKLNAISFDAAPTWSTTSLPATVTGDAISVQLVAPGATTFALQSGDSLPTGLTLSASGLLSGSVTVVNSTTYSFTILASDAENQTTPSALSITILSGDADFNRTSILLKVSDSSATNNNTIVDSSSNNFAVTRNGNVSQGTVSPFSGAGWSTYYSGTTGDAVSVTANSAFNPRSTSTTFECWVFPTARSTGSNPTFNSKIIDFYTAYNNRCDIAINSSGYLTINRDNGSGATSNTSATLIPLNTWTHIAWTWDGTSNKFFVNGVDVTSTFSNPTLSGQFPLSITSPAVYVGAGYYGNGGTNWVDPFTGFISNARLVKGSVLYTANFTPSTSALSAVSGTALLLNATPGIRDLSSNNYTVSKAGSTSVSAFSPFTPSASYNSSANGASVYFDGNGDYLTVPSNSAFGFGTGDFTIECWVNFKSVSGYQLIAMLGDGIDATPVQRLCAWSLYLGDGSLNFNRYSPSFAGFNIGWSPSIDQWYHIAISRSGSSLKAFINGVQAAVQTNSADYSVVNSTPLHIGRFIAGGGVTYSMNAFMSNLRIVKGTALYTSNFTPSTSPLTAVSGTSLLLSGTNAKIYDAASKSVVETISSAVASSSTVKFGQSMYFPNDLSGLELTTSPLTLIGSQDFTVEFWVNSASPGTSQALFGTRSALAPQDQTHIGIDIQINNSRIRSTTANIVYVTGTTPILANTWYHVALSRSGSNLRLFVNGNLEGTYTTLHNHWNNRIYIGGNPAYIEDFRFSRFARYTSSFTAPTTTFIAK